ncbi:MAG: hypothetical protein Q8P89_03730 [bacterium]|nr:hypothetical protein [bacterium]
MPNIERFVYKVVGQEVGRIGNVALVECNKNQLIATRPNISLDGPTIHKRRRAAPKIPEGVLIDENIYLIDGHRKAVSSIKEGEDTITCRVLQTSNPNIISRVIRRGHGPIVELL